MSERVQRVLHVETRYGYFYVTNQFGGFTRHDSEAEARAAIAKDVSRYGDVEASSEGRT